MNERQRKLALSLAKAIMPAGDFERALAVEVRDTGFGFDEFGLEKEAAVLAFGIARVLHKHYFRVQSYGIENVPSTGRALLIANHSGTLPLDAVMIAADIAANMAKPRLMRAMVDNFVGFLPFVNVMFARIGQVVGARRNFNDLLSNDELLAIFPEGTKGLGKPFSRRYQLARFNVGFIESALRYKAPIVPIAVVGAEEQLPMVGNLKPIARLFNFPYFPITPFFPLLGPIGMLPMPVQYHIYYGKPLHFYEEYSAETINEPEKVRMLAHQVQMTIQDMLIAGLDQRQSVFGFGAA